MIPKDFELFLVEKHRDEFLEWMKKKDYEEWDDIRGPAQLDLQIKYNNEKVRNLYKTPKRWWWWK